MYQLITTTGLIINLYCSTMAEAIEDAKANGYTIVTITKIM